MTAHRFAACRLAFALAMTSARAANRGVASCTIDYRRLGDPGGGWPGTRALADGLRVLLGPAH